MTNILIKKQCRICLDDNDQDELFSPCKCNGTSKYVHRSCLNTWIESSSEAKTECMECKYKYQIEDLNSYIFKFIKIVKNPIYLFYFLLFMNFIIVALTILIDNNFLIRIIYNYDKTYGIVGYYDKTVIRFNIYLCYAVTIMLFFLIPCLFVTNILYNEDSSYNTIMYNSKKPMIINIIGIIFSYAYYNTCFYYIFTQYLCFIFSYNFSKFFHNKFLKYNIKIKEYVPEISDNNFYDIDLEIDSSNRSINSNDYNIIATRTSYQL